MRASVPVPDVVREAIKGFLVGVVPLQGHLDGGAIFCVFNVDGWLVQNRLVAVQVLDKSINSTGVHEVVGITGPLVCDADVHTLVEVAQLAEALTQDLEGEVQNIVENFGIRHEPHAGSALGRGPHFGQRLVRAAPGKRHGVFFPALPDGEPQLGAEPVHTRNTNAMKAARNLVGILAVGVGVIKFPARMKHRHDHFGGGPVLFFVEIHGDAAAVVLYRATAVGVDDHVHAGAIPRQGLVNGVVHDLVDHLVKAASVVGIPDIHAWPFSDSLQVPEDRDVIGGVGG